jgi:Coenzyme PQQ synthesis protein D (PqqD)
MIPAMPAELVTIPENVIAKKVGEETVLLDFEAGVYYGLDSVGSRMWELLAEGKSLEEVNEAMVGEYDATPETIAHDLDALVAELESHGLVARRSAES